MSEDAASGPPRSFYVISSIALAWNLVGVMLYVMQVTMSDGNRPFMAVFMALVIIGIRASRGPFRIRSGSRRWAPVFDRRFR